MEGLSLDMTAIDCCDFEHGSCMVNMWKVSFWTLSIVILKRDKTALLIGMAMLFHLVGEKLLIFTGQVKWPSERKDI